MILTIIGAILIFSLIIFVHELGHFLTARIFKMTVHEFAIGMGPAIFKKQGKETLYSIRAIPMGGYCKIEGEDGDSESEGAFCAKKPLPRIIVLAAGAAMNLLLGFIIVLCLVASSAKGGLTTTVVDTVNPDSPAAAFLEQGDRITGINGKAVHIKRDLNFALSLTEGAESTVTYVRDGKKYTQTFTPMETEYEDGSKGYVLGFNIAVASPTVSGVLHEAFFQTVWMVKLVFLSLRMLVSGQAGLNDLSGPVGVVSAMNTAAQSSLPSLLFFAAFLAVNIGMMNLLPLPALDGGRILFVFIELIFRKPVPPEKEGLIHAIGFLLLILLMLYATFNDIVRLFT